MLDLHYAPGNANLAPHMLLHALDLPHRLVPVDRGSAAHKGPAGPPVYLPLDNMVVNLADPGGERVAQVGITFELRDAAAAETVKQFLPTIRSGVLLLVSQKTSEEMLQREGKEKLAADMIIIVQ